MNHIVCCQGMLQNILSIKKFIQHLGKPSPTDGDNDDCNDNHDSNDGNFGGDDEKWPKNIQILWLLSKNVPSLGTFTWKKGQNIWAWVTPTPISRAMPESKQLFFNGSLPLVGR